MQWTNKSYSSESHRRSLQLSLLVHNLAQVAVAVRLVLAQIRGRQRYIAVSNLGTLTILTNDRLLVRCSHDGGYERCNRVIKKSLEIRPYRYSAGTRWSNGKKHVPALTRL